MCLVRRNRSRVVLVLLHMLVLVLVELVRYWCMRWYRRGLVDGLLLDVVVVFMQIEIGVGYMLLGLVLYLVGVDLLGRVRMLVVLELVVAVVQKHIGGRHSFHNVVHVAEVVVSSIV